MVAKIRTVALIDGFNLYHAINALGKQHLKWVDLWALCDVFAPAPDHQLHAVHYFSAFAEWHKSRYRRHREYVKAIQRFGVDVDMSAFKRKPQQCRNCGHTWTKHEEKETDVKIALCLVNLAVHGSYDKALLVSQDSDLSPAVRMARRIHPSGQIKIVTPVGRAHSSELRAASGIKPAAVKEIHLEHCLLPDKVLGPDDTVVANRPSEYDPPAS